MRGFGGLIVQELQDIRLLWDDGGGVLWVVMWQLGNGSLIRNFETTSTFDAATQEFVINSPTVTSLKWWIGMAAETATHCAVYARLIIGDQDHGIDSLR